MWHKSSLSAMQIGLALRFSLHFVPRFANFAQ
jgi:hypothetical protein